MPGPGLRVISPAIDTIAGQPVTPAGGSVIPPPPWSVTGHFTNDHLKPPLAMAYQISDGSVNSFPVPPLPNTDTQVNFFFSLSSADISSNGTFVLNVYIWNEDGAGTISPPVSIQATGFDPSTPPTPQPGFPSGAP